MSNDKAAVGTFPPGNWSPRPEPTSDEIDRVLETAHAWWWYGAFGGADSCLDTYLNLFDRYLGEQVRRRAIAESGQ